jgi:hypothetical protein
VSYQRSRRRRRGLGESAVPSPCDDNPDDPVCQELEIQMDPMYVGRGTPDASQAASAAATAAVTAPATDAAASAAGLAIPTGTILMLAAVGGLLYWTMNVGRK